VSSQSEFNEGVVAAFGFLTSELGFRSIVPSSESSLEPVRFEKSPFIVEVYWGKGEVDVGIRVTIDTSILRPYRRKSFDEGEIARHLKPDIFRVPRAVPLRGTSLEKALADVRFYAGLMKEYCRDILRGDTKVLEEILQKDAQ
jgi:hypothetical protein